MSNFSKIVLLIVLVLSFFFIKEKTGFNLHGGHALDGINMNVPQNFNGAEEAVKKPEEIIKKNEEQAETAGVYFLALDLDGSGIYRKVMRKMRPGSSKINTALNELLKGPDVFEKALGAYSEIPQNTRLLGIKETDKKIIINLSSDFQNGGGTDSIYSRMMQLIKTALSNSGGRQVYLHLDGKQIKFIGGEGIMVTQPLTEKSLEN